MVTSSNVRLGRLVAYLVGPDAEAALDCVLERVFGSSVSGCRSVS